MPDSPPGIPSGPEPAPAAPPAVDLPATFGKYFLTEKLATGGMAEIYLAKLVGPGGFEKQLVIKQIHPRLSGQRHFVDLFVAEAKILVTLAHGNVVPVYELGVIDDTYFIAMEYIDGPTLYRLTETLRRRGVRMAPPIAAWITARILEGLDYAHRKADGVIHRDLSPRNVMLSRDGEIKLVDFGIAVTLGDGGEDDTAQSAPTGSFPYMSPEQVRKQPLTGQTDLFSAGVLLWEMLVGHRLFARSDPDATLHAVVDLDIPRPSTENPDVPARLDDVVMRALDRDLAARWQSAGDMLAALQRYLYSLDDTPGPRDVAALVARYCPPETRRLPTHHDEHEAEAAAELTRPRGRAAAVAPLTAGEAPRPGPATAVIPRDGAARGKRGPRARTETFATHVELEQMLERGGPPRREDGARGDAVDDGGDAAARGRAEAGRDDDSRMRGGDAGNRGDEDREARDHEGRERGDATPVRPRAARVIAEVEHGELDGAPGASAGAADVAVEPAIARPELPPLQMPGRQAPSTSLLIFAAIGALALGGAAIFVFFQGRGAVERGGLPRRGSAEVPGDTSAAGAAGGGAATAGGGTATAGGGAATAGGGAVTSGGGAATASGGSADGGSATAGGGAATAGGGAATAGGGAATAGGGTATAGGGAATAGGGAATAGGGAVTAGGGSVTAGGGAATGSRGSAAGAVPRQTGTPPRDGTAAPQLPPRGGAGPARPPREAGAVHSGSGTNPAHPDAREPTVPSTRPDGAAARATGTATLTIGAIPWGTVLLDGKPIGRTPIDHLTVPAGHHVVSVTFGGEDPPRTQSFPIDLGAGDAKELVADFTRQ